MMIRFGSLYIFSFPYHAMPAANDWVLEHEPVTYNYKKPVY